MDEARLLRIQESIPKRFFFEDSFEKNGFPAKILANLPLRYDGVEHGNFLNCSPLLKKEQELHLFRKFNYLRYRLVKLTEGFQPSDENPWPKPCRGRKLKNLRESGVRELETLITRITETRNIILKANTRLVVKQVYRHAEYDSFEYHEMLSNAYCHIMKAIDNFDFRRGFKFSTYCVNVLKTNLGRDRGTLEKLKAPLENWECIDSTPSRFDADFSEVNSSYNKEIIEKVFEFLKRTMNKPEDKVEVLRGYYGLEGGEPMLLRELGEKLGISKERIRQIKRQALEAATNCGLVYDPLV